MVSIQIDGKDFEVEEGLAAAPICLKLDPIPSYHLVEEVLHTGRTTACCSVPMVARGPELLLIPDQYPAQVAVRVAQRR